MSSRMPKMLLVFCDGTGMDGLVSTHRRAIAIAIAPDGGGGGTTVQAATNVIRLSRAIQSVQTLPDGREMEQIVFYQSGIGSVANFAGQTIAEDSATQIFGIAVASKIRDCYAFIAQNYVAGDQICLFGFSRGAYTARKVAGLINRIGLLKREDFGNFFTIWMDLVNGRPVPTPAAPIPIKCVGVWDTVDSVFGSVLPLNPVIDALGIKDTTILPNVEHALHAVSLQENRGKFMCTLWTVPDEGLSKGQVFKQQFFPGAHSDVGGGYPRHELADLTLFWMAGEISAFVAIDLDFIANSRQAIPDAAWGATQPHNSFDEAPLLQKPLLGHTNRLEGGAITKNSVFHQSINFAPAKLTDPIFMVTLPALKHSFGAGWQPTYAPLNAFEIKSRNNWPIHLSTKAPIPVFEAPADIITGINKGISGIAQALNTL